MMSVRLVASVASMVVVVRRRGLMRITRDLIITVVAVVVIALIVASVILSIPIILSISSISIIVIAVIIQVRIRISSTRLTVGWTLCCVEVGRALI
jgi:hypothetical protein